MGAFQAGFRIADSPDSEVNEDLSYRYMCFLSCADGLEDLPAKTCFLNITVPFKRFGHGLSAFDCDTLDRSQRLFLHAVGSGQMAQGIISM